MEYIYLLTNVHVPKLVKFGFSRRDPRRRASELSAATGVPGKWEVAHFWEVEDGYGVEQEVFFHLADKRLGKKEFLQMEPTDAIARISAVIDDVGINPTVRAKGEAERAKLERTRLATERIAARDAVRAINGEIHRLVRPIEELLARRAKFTGGILTLIAFVSGVITGNARDADPLVIGLIFAGAGWFLPIPLLIEFVVRYGTPNKKDIDRAYREGRKKVLAKHMLTEDAFTDLDEKGEKWIWGNTSDHEIEMLTNPGKMIDGSGLEDEDYEVSDTARKQPQVFTKAEPKPRPQ